MTKQEQDKLWDDLSEESKKRVAIEYKDSIDGSPFKRAIDYLFGSHNLNPKPQIKTWEDCQEMNEDSNFFIRIDDNLELHDKIHSKCIATLKIAKLIELGYGGMVSEEENNNAKIKKYAPLYYGEKGFVIECFYRLQDRVLSFHTKQQAKEFMSHESNRKLVEQYYMM